MPAKVILWPEESGATDNSLVGGKFANLATLRRANVNVPLAFSISATAYRDFVGKFEGNLRDVLSTVDYSTFASIERASESIRRTITGAEMPTDVRSQVASAYKELASRAGAKDDSLPVAVRSSATVEDSADSSLAGQHETYLWVRGEDDLMRRVVDCWASVFTARSLRYRDSKGLDQLGEEMAVAVQIMVRSTSSGVMFTLNPKNGDPSKIVIESSWGLGEAIVGGLVTPDLFTVDKVTFELLERRLNRKQREFAVVNGKVVERAVEEARQMAPSIPEDHAINLAKLGKAVEKQYGYPMDIEWAVDSSLKFPNDTFILQARPETVWSQKKREASLSSSSALDLVVDKLIRGERVGE
ncbi:MAG: hypothetical protein LYZ70_00605 [Nitrososphaerales archaeon]|nr:hypothetical protein [Nitrososphaerales archaeon]